MRSITRRTFLQTSALLAATATALAKPKTPKPLIAYVGTFSSPLHNTLPTQVDLPPGNGRGIHLFQVDRSTGALKPAGIVEMGNSPNCIVIDPARALLFSTNETDRVAPGNQGTVSAFAINRADGQLTHLNTIPSGGAGPTYASLHPSKKFLLVANYFGGNVSVLPILPNGHLAGPTDTKQDTAPLGPKKATNAPPGSFAFSGHDHTHAHMIQADPSGRFVLHVDLATDQIHIWKIDLATGVLAPNDPPSISFPAGDGPRHFAFHPNARWLYTIQEEASTLALLDYDPANGRLTHRQTLSSLPPGYAGSNFTSEILVSPNGAHLYAANRLHDSIAIFKIAKDGTLAYLTEEWTRGDYPRSFNFDPTGRFLYSCNQRADHLTTFRVNPRTGRLTFTNHYTPVGNPSSIAFLDLAA